jgi:hypothetical protein
VQLGAGGGVLQQDALFEDRGSTQLGAGGRVLATRRKEGGQRRFVEARQDELLLARVDVDVTHREDAGDAGLELLGVHRDLLAVDAQAPVGDRAELGAEAEEHQQHVQRHHACDAVGAGELQALRRRPASSSKPVIWPTTNCIS